MSKAVVYLKAAAENAAEAEDDALAAGLTKGGQLKGELTLAIYELGNCFRNGWVPPGIRMSADV
jgi:TPR repeat protein